MKPAPRKISFAEMFKVGEGATLCGYSDRHACTVIKVTAKTATLQYDKATLLNGMDSNEPDKLVCHAGGFCGHVEGDQRYAYESDPKGHTVIARMTKRTTVKIVPSGKTEKRVYIHGGPEVDVELYEEVEEPVVKTAGGDRVVAGRSHYHDYNF